MLIKNILIGMLIFLFFLGLSGAVIAGEVKKSYASFSDLITPMNLENNNIEFEYSPIQFNSLASMPLVNTNSNVIDFDYSPKDDAQSTAVLPSVNTNSENIRFDYSPRSINCGASHC